MPTFNFEIIFDWCQTILISLLLVITVPLATYVYFKLIFSEPFLDNYTFKLIAVNGIAGVLSATSYLFVYQLTSYHFMYWWYKFIESTNLVRTLSILNVFLAEIFLNSALFVALNRIQRMLFQKMNRNDSAFFVFAILMSSLLSLPGVLDYCFYTKLAFVEWTLGLGDGWDDPIMLPSQETSNTIFNSIASILDVVVSIATLAANMLLAFLITRKGSKSDAKKSNAERGLIITSVSSYVFYTLFLINKLCAQLFKFPFSANAQFLFLGVARLSPVWCLIIFAPSVRRSVFKFLNKRTLTPVNSIVLRIVMLPPGIDPGRTKSNC